jgi:hypothetical protein
MNRRNFLKNLGSATYEATKAQVPTTPKIIQKVREIDDFATKAKKYDNFAENINSGLEKSVSRRQFLKNSAKPAARAAINTLESGAKGAAYLSEGSLIPNPQTMQPISSLADKFREAVRYIKFQKGEDMKHFANFGFGNEVAKGVGRNALLIGGGLLGYGAGKALAGNPQETPEYIGYNQSQESWNKDPQNDILKEKALSDYDRYINTPEARKEKYLTQGGALVGAGVGLVLGKKYLRGGKANFGIGSTIGLGLAGGLAGNYIGNSIGRKPEIDNQYKTLNDNYYAKLGEIYPQVESLDEPDPTEEELVRRRSAYDELTKDYLSKVAPLNEKYKDYKQGVENRSNLGFYAGAGLGLLAANRGKLANPVKAYKNWQWQQNRKNSMPIR